MGEILRQDAQARISHKLHRDRAVCGEPPGGVFSVVESLEIACIQPVCVPDQRETLAGVKQELPGLTRIGCDIDQDSVASGSGSSTPATMRARESLVSRIRWTLWSRGRAVVSNQTALAVHGVGEFESARTHLTVPPEFSMSDPAVILHHADLPEDDVVERNGFRLTTAARALIDTAALGADEDQLSRAIEDAREAGLLTTRQLRQRAEAVDPRAALYIERAIHRSAAP